MDSLLLKTESRLESKVEGSREHSFHDSFKVKESSPLPPVACLVILDSNTRAEKRAPWETCFKFMPVIKQTMQIPFLPGFGFYQALLVMNSYISFENTSMVKAILQEPVSGSQVSIGDVEEDAMDRYVGDMSELTLRIQRGWVKKEKHRRRETEWCIRAAIFSSRFTRNPVETHTTHSSSLSP